MSMIDLSCSEGIDPVWRLFEPNLSVRAFDPNLQVMTLSGEKMAYKQFMRQFTEDDLIFYRK